MRWKPIAVITLLMALALAETCWSRGERPPVLLDATTQYANAPVRLALYVPSMETSEDKPFGFVAEIQNAGDQPVALDPELRMDSNTSPPDPHAQPLPADRMFILLHLTRPLPRPGDTREFRDVDPMLMIDDNRVGKDMVIPVGSSSFARIDVDDMVFLAGDNTIELTVVLNGEVIASSGRMHIQGLPAKR